LLFNCLFVLCLCPGPACALSVRSACSFVVRQPVQHHHCSFLAQPVQPCSLVQLLCLPAQPAHQPVRLLRKPVHCPVQPSLFSSALSVQPSPAHQPSPSVPFCSFSLFVSVHLFVRSSVRSRSFVRSPVRSFVRSSSSVPPVRRACLFVPACPFVVVRLFTTVRLFVRSKHACSFETVCSPVRSFVRSVRSFVARSAPLLSPARSFVRSVHSFIRSFKKEKNNFYRDRGNLLHDDGER
jgi:hypothetical protein